MPLGANSAIDPVRSEVHWQVKFPQAFILEDIVLTSTIVLSILPEVSIAKIPLHYQDRENNESGET